jgi:peptidyl-dipeptidase Dcp
MTNPLLRDWTSEFCLPPFTEISDEDFAPAFDEALEAGRAAIAQIADAPDAPSFANTIEALEMADALLDRVAGVFYNLAGSDSNPARDKLQRELSPKLSAYSSEITNNNTLFKRIETLWAARETLDLTDEQARVLMLYRRMFVRAGAALEGAAVQRLTAVKSELASLGTAFTQNL